MSRRPPVTDWATDFDHLDPRWAEDPFPIWDELRQKCPIAHTERFMGVYLPTRYEDVRAIAHDTEHFSSHRVFVREGMPPKGGAAPITTDPPKHADAKAVLLSAFTRKAIECHATKTREICRGLVEQIAGKSACDAAVDYAQEIPVRVMAHMLGIPAEDGERFRTWTHQLLVQGITDEDIGQRATDEMTEYFQAEAEKRRDAPGDDLISHLLRACINGNPLSHNHFFGTLRLLLVAGIDTTWSAIGASLWHLATHDADRRRLVAEPDLLPVAIEEFLRAYSPVTMAREIVKETRINGTTFNPGEMVLLSFPAANRDPAVFPYADRVIIDRRQSRHAAFGLGIHTCIGASLARMQIRTALEQWLARIPEFRLDSNEKVTWSEGPVRGPRRVPILVG
ncbi:MAG: cytochrome P450 [Xanthobacteraceae bacterium]